MVGSPHVFILNVGTSSLKVALMGGAERVGTFLAEQLGTAEAVLRFELTRGTPNMNHADALYRILQCIEKWNSSMVEGSVATGYQVVHGGSTFGDSVLIDDEVGGSTFRDSVLIMTKSSNRSRQSLILRRCTYPEIVSKLDLQVALT
jgi:acetate kinase